MAETGATPAPVSQLQFERGKTEHETRGELLSTCAICETLSIWLGLAESVPDNPQALGNLRYDPARPVIDLGTVEETLASPCSQHTAIVKHLQLRFEEDVECGYKAHFDTGVRLTRQHNGIVRVQVPSTNRTAVIPTLVLADNPQAGHLGDSRVLDREWVDLRVIQQWIIACSESHGERCENPIKIMRTVPDLLVDVRRKCIVRGKKDHRYMALSYRSGNAAPFRLSLRDLDKFGKDGVLEDVQILEKLPLTVRHAILLADELGYAHVWTDVLCIVYDGPATLADQLNQMSAIYARAAMTTIVAEGDGADGIAGLNDISGPRDSPQVVFALRDYHLIMLGEEERIDAVHSTLAYHTRGWTYQEYIMSCRKLVFTNQQAYWVCQCGRKHESDARDVDRESLERSQFIRSGHPDLLELSDLLSGYNVRDLTYSWDALPAVAGLLAVLSRSFEGGFLYGLPERFFDVALSWRPCYIRRGRKLERDVCTARLGTLLGCESESTRPGELEMPSWSWTAWQGRFAFPSDEVGQVLSYGPDDEDFRETSPITEWYTGSEPSSRNRRRIISNWHADRKSIDDQDKLLPEGWTRMEASVVIKGPEEELEGWPRPKLWRPTIYRHQSSEKIEEPTFWYYPFRMPEINDSTPSKVPEQTRYLFCRTRRASLKLHIGLYKGEDFPSDSFSIELHAKNEYVGELYHHNKVQLEEEIETITKRNGVSAVIDVVAISRSFLWFERHHVINILCVKWDKGIAFRLASGWVYEEKWNFLDLEEIDLVLG
jgi:hypothetical protein